MYIFEKYDNFRYNLITIYIACLVVRFEVEFYFSAEIFNNLWEQVSRKAKCSK